MRCLFFIFLFLFRFCYSQTEEPTIHIQLPQIIIYGFKSNSEKEKWNKLARNVKKVLPYARIAAKEYNQLNKETIGKSEREKERMTDEVEKNLKIKFKGELEGLTMSQGRILLKLIDRECNVTAYNLVKDFKGLFPAIFWQSVGIVFNQNLKSNYDPSGKDREIEEIVYLIDSGQF